MVQHGVVAIIENCDPVLGFHAFKCHRSRDVIQQSIKASQPGKTGKDVNKELCRDITVELVKTVEHIKGFFFYLLNDLNTVRLGSKDNYRTLLRQPLTTHRLRYSLSITSIHVYDTSLLAEKGKGPRKKQEGHDGPVSLYWLIREIHSYQTLHFLGIGLKHKTSYKD